MGVTLKGKAKKSMLYKESNLTDNAFITHDVA